jgi:hypothetical protein
VTNVVRYPSDASAILGASISIGHSGDHIIALALGICSATLTQTHAALIELVPFFEDNYNFSAVTLPIPIFSPSSVIIDSDPITQIPQHGDTFASTPIGFSKTSYQILPSGFKVSSESALQGAAVTVTLTDIRFRPTIDLRYDFEEFWTGILSTGGHCRAHNIVISRGIR